jgi:hypothetical protein
MTVWVVAVVAGRVGQHIERRIKVSDTIEYSWDWAVKFEKI